MDAVTLFSWPDGALSMGLCSTSFSGASLVEHPSYSGLTRSSRQEWRCGYCGSIMPREVRRCESCTAWRKEVY